MSGLRTTLEAAAIAVALALLAAMAQRLTGAEGLLLADGQPVFGDFICFWSAGRAALDGHAALVHDRDLLFSYHEAAVPDVRYVAPWNSPPTFLLIAAGLAILPYPAAALLFLAVSAALYFYAARKLLPDARALVFAATLPAALYHLGTVQTGLLMAGVSGLALLCLDKRPLASGALVGLLAIKPHLAILWPLMLAFSGRWRAFAAAAASTLSFMLAAGLAFGFDSYGRFLENLGPSQAMISSQALTTPAYASLYANLLGLGAPQWLAFGAHGLSAGAALSIALWTFWRGARKGAPAQGAALCAATLLVSPYLFFYDFTLLAVGAALLGAPRDRFETIAMVLAWGAALSLPLGYLAPLPLAPFASWLVLAAAVRRTGSGQALPAPAPRT